MRLSWKGVCIFLCAVLLSACARTSPYVDPDYREAGKTTMPPSSELAYQVFLIGDTGKATRDMPVLQLLQRQLVGAGEKSAVIFLGDNVSGRGMPDSAAIDRSEAEARLMAQIEAVRDFEGRIVFIPGNADWGNGSNYGLDAVRRQEAFVEAALGRGNTFLPDDGFPGPVEIDLTKDLALVVLDTQWWLHEGEKPYGETGEYDIGEDGDFLLELDDVVKRERNDHLLVVGHHPLYSNGKHGGFFPLSAHLFPLKPLYVPLPGVGSLYPLYRRIVGKNQDLARRRYRSLRRALESIFETHESLVYVSGHDHNLQYFPMGDQHYVVSGAGSDPEPLAQGGGAVFTAGVPGFMTLHYYKDASVWLQAWTPTGDGMGRVLFQTQLSEPDPERVEKGLPAAEATDHLDYTDSTAVAAANPALAAGGLKRFLWGKNHRDVWTAPLTLPYFDIGAEAGGLTPVKRGGGLMSTSIRLEAADGKEYVLRSVKKDPSRALSEELQSTVAAVISRDQAATQHPYGALLVPPLAEALGIYHAKPRAVYVPDDPRLGIYAEDIGGQVALFEERPDDDMSDASHFGNSREVESAPDMYHEVTDDNDHRVDQPAYARARLFDMLISDWDRHVDQWRWASFEPYELDPTLEGEARKQGKIYRPIPRDRDVAFNWLDGLLPGLAQPFTKYQDFRTSYGNLKGLTWNAWEQDHRFLSVLDRDDWLDIALDMQTALTDAVIEEAVRQWPESLFAQKGQTFIRILKARRDQLPAVAEKFYRLHARSVDVVGSNKHERFEVRRLNDDETEVVMYKTTKEGEVVAERYRRVFHRDETEEVFLYGLGGNDQFDISGEVGRGITVAAVGGPGEDTFVDQSRVGGLGKKTRFYDTDADNTWKPGPETKVIRSDDPEINHYENKTPPYHIYFGPVSPAVVLSSDSDNGLRLGGGVRITRQGLRKHPYASAHTLTASYALGAGALATTYQGHWVAEFEGWDKRLDVQWFGPNTIRNFFGFGNKTTNQENRPEIFNQTRLTQFTITPALMKTGGAGLTMRLGPRFEITEVKQDEDRFVGDPASGISPRTFGDQWYVGGEAELSFSSTDRPVNPRQGFAWSALGRLNVGARDAEGTFGTVGSQVTFYVSPILHPQVTLAGRIGGAHIFGDFPYYHASTLGGIENLRGYRNDRFAGRSSLFQNAELRLALFQFSTYLAPGEAGVLGFVDNGRVWIDGELSRNWHQGYGGGVWLNFFSQFVVTGTYGVSEEEEAFTLRVGFLY